MRLIETTHLKTWASSKAAESRFPHILKALICAVIQPEKLRMPSGSAIWLPGYDGEITNNETNRFVPLGISVWEASTDSDVKGKADIDYKKRSYDQKKDQEIGIDRQSTTFIFATPRIWKNKQNWVAERKAEKIWLNVVVIDGLDIQDWLESAPAVNLQFAAEIGLAPEEGLQTHIDAWEEWSHYSDPPALEALVLNGREDQVKEFINRLVTPAGIFTVRGDSPREAWGFALAAIRQIPSEEDRQNIQSRLVVADSEYTAHRLGHLKNLIIILKQVKDQVSGFLSSHGNCHLIIPEGNDARSERNVIVLNRPIYGPFVEALKKMGFNEEESERESRACGLSVTIFQRRRAHATFKRPSWAEADRANKLLPALLVGRWSDNSEADREVLCFLTEITNYSTIQGHFQQFLLIDEPPLLKIGEMWSLTAPVDAFQLIARYLSPALMDRFKTAFKDVLGKIDPRVEISPDEWIMYDLKGEKGHSGWLRSGMAETLLLISERGKEAQIPFMASPAAYAEEVVRGIPNLKNDWRILASLRDQCARLMEAAPSPFLDSIEYFIKEKPVDIKRLFMEGKGIFGPGSMHTGLLWGLETLAWIPEYLLRVASILSKLAGLDPGGRLINRPINSLLEIFLWWNPGTNATAKEKLTALDVILENDPEIGWALLVKLLPTSSQSFSHMTSKPRWRYLGDIPEESKTRRGVMKYLSAILDRALDNVGDYPERWREVLSSLRFIDNPHQDRALTLLRDVVQKQMPHEKKIALWETLRDFINEHRAFRDADWAVSEHLLNKLDDILVFVMPDDHIERHRWLFDEWLPDLPEREEYAEHEKKVEALRRHAVQEIFEAQGIEGLIGLGIKCKLPGFIASAVVPLLENIGMACELVNRAIHAGESGIYLAGQISAQALALYGQEWRNFITEKACSQTWVPDVIAVLISFWPDNNSTWIYAASLGEEIENNYWGKKPIFLINGSTTEKVYQIEHLITAGRAAHVFDRVISNMKIIPTETLLRLFDAAFDELEKARTIEEIRKLGMNAHDTHRFLDELRNREDIQREDLARKEYRALPILGSLKSQGLTIHEFMAEDPNFFVDVLCAAFLPANRDKKQDVEPTLEERLKAETSYKLLKGMHLIPGKGEGDELNETVLEQWINSVRKKSSDLDRQVIADIHIGEILAHSPTDPQDGAWPHRIIRNIIEKFQSNDIDRGLLIERRNMRGVFSKALYEGGVQERILAKQYGDWAKISITQWPRMGRVLDILKRGWEEMSREEDLRAEQEKRET